MAIRKVSRCDLCTKKFVNKNALLKHRKATGHKPRAITASKYLNPPDRAQ